MFGSRLQEKLRNDEGQDGKVTNWADGSVCVLFFFLFCFFLINTTMKVGCAEASGTLEQCLLATDHCFAPPSTLHPLYSA